MGRDGAAGLGQARQCGCGSGHLTTRQIEVLRLAATGLSDNQIGTQLGISRRTVGDHLNVMRRRAGARNRGELIARSYAVEILVGCPPRWSGKRCLLIRQRPPLNGSADAQRVSENPARNASCSITPDSRFLDTAGGMGQTPAVGGTVLGGAGEPPGATGVLIGYVRVYTRDRNLDQQIDALRAADCSSIFVDKTPSCKKSERRELRRLLDYARPGDALVVASLDRLSRSLQDLISLVAELRRRGVGLKALHENLDTTTPGGRVIFDVFAALAEFLRELMADRTHEGLAAAPARGRVRGRPTVMTADKITAARALLPEASIAAIARQIGVSRGTLYAHMDAITARARRNNHNAPDA